MSWITKNISSLLALIITISYVILMLTCTILKVESPYFNQYSLVEMAIITFYFGSSLKDKNNKDGEN